jgi:hypothetical protein
LAFQRFMKKENKMDMMLSIVIFTVVICVLVFITVNRPNGPENLYNQGIGQYVGQ